MNKGEKNELILKVYLCYLKKKNDENSPFGLIKSLGFDEDSYNYLKNVKKEERIDKYKALLNSKNIPFEADVFTWHNENL